MHKGLLKTGAILSMLAVALGAFGAHGLKKIVPPEQVNVFDTGVRYQIYHSLAILIVGILAEKFSSKNIVRAGYSFLTGIILFSGSLYLLTFFKAQGVVGLSGIGIITPIGGVVFILGWIFLVLGLRDSK
jgi:uncharacterized membrane protein YgdD (TMEM256/DUF423 family)